MALRLLRVANQNCGYSIEYLQISAEASMASGRVEAHHNPQTIQPC